MFGRRSAAQKNYRDSRRACEAKVFWKCDQLIPIIHDRRESQIEARFRVAAFRLLMFRARAASLNSEPNLYRASKCFARRAWLRVCSRAHGTKTGDER